MADYLLDSDAVVDYLRRYQPTALLIQDLMLRGEHLATCDVVLAEIYSGLHPWQEALAAEFLPTLKFLPASAAAAEQAGRWRYQFARQRPAVAFDRCTDRSNGAGVPGYARHC